MIAETAKVLIALIVAEDDDNVWLCRIAVGLRLVLGPSKIGNGNQNYPKKERSDWFSGHEGSQVIAGADFLAFAFP